MAKRGETRGLGAVGESPSDWTVPVLTRISKRADYELAKRLQEIMLSKSAFLRRLLYTELFGDKAK